MRVRDIMTSEVRTCRPETALPQVADMMRSGCCGAIPVVDAAGRVQGIITDRDITMELVRSTRKPINIAAHEVMTPTVRTCRPDEDVRLALRTMKEYRVRRLPVTDPEGRLKGILSMDDIILRALAPDAPSTDEILNSLREIVMRMAADNDPVDADGRLMSLPG